MMNALKNGSISSPDPMSVKKWNALLWNAVTLGDVEQVRWALGQGADVNHCNNQGKFLLIHLTDLIILDEEYNPDFEKIFNELIRLPQVKLNTLDTQRTWMIAAGNQNKTLGEYHLNVIERFAYGGYLDQVEQLLTLGAPHSLKGSIRLTHLALTRGDYTMLKLFYKHECLNVDHQDEKGRTALHVATHCAWGKNCMQFLLELGANPNIQDHEGVTPLMNALEMNVPGLVELLVSHGAQIDIKNHQGLSVYDQLMKTCASSDLQDPGEIWLERQDKIIELLKPSLTACREREMLLEQSHHSGETLYPAVKRLGRL